MSQRITETELRVGGEEKAKCYDLLGIMGSTYT